MIVTAVLDDWQRVARACADWAPLEARDRLPALRMFGLAGMRAGKIGLEYAMRPLQPSIAI